MFSTLCFLVGIFGTGFIVGWSVRKHGHGKQKPCPPCPPCPPVNTESHINFNIGPVTDKKE